MIHEMLIALGSWSMLDTWIVVTAALTAMACALPGTFLFLRRQSMLGDALSHTSLLGIVLAFLLSHALLTSGWISEQTYFATRYSVMALGAIVIGILFALVTEVVRKLGKVESSAALGVVFTTMFALGLLLIRVAADSVHIDPDCVLYGIVETAILDTIPGTSIPRPAVVGAVMVAANLLLLLIFYKELKITAFDPKLATTMGIHADLAHYALMAVTAATLVMAFETVGSILVIAMLIAPPATASLLTVRLGRMVVLGLFIAAAGALVGHAMAIALPAPIFSRLGFPTVVDASTAGMTAVASGLFFVLAIFFAPHQGVVSKALGNWRLGLKILREDVLGLLYRLEEAGALRQAGALPGTIGEALRARRPMVALAIHALKREGSLAAAGAGYRLTPSGREAAQQLVRSHRLWESYMAKHFVVPDDHLHDTAARVEHYISPGVRSQLAAELQGPATDPHGRQIPPEDKS